MKTKVSSGWVKVKIEPVNPIRKPSESRKINNPSLLKAQNVLSLIASHI